MASNQAGKKPETVDSYDNPYISPRTKQFYLSTDSADVHFICGDSNAERIPAHKVIMSVASDAFNAMFHGGLREPDDVRIVDASADGFKEFLKFFYFDKIQLNMDHIEEVVYLCTKYVYSSSIRICELFLLDSLNIENVCFCYGLAITYDLIELKQKCGEIVTQDTVAVLQTGGFLECDNAVLAAVLKLDSFSCIEIDLFDSCMTWLEVAGNERKVTRQLIDEQLGDSFRDIRFGSMTCERLAGMLSKYSDLFTDDEYLEIAQLIASEDYHSVLFEGEPRLFPWNQSDMIEWPVFSTHGGWRNFHEFESTTFSTEEHILLGEITLEEMMSMEETSIELLILKKSLFDHDDGNSQNVLQQRIELIKNLYLSNRGRLHKPLILSPSFEYEIQLKMASVPFESKYSTLYFHRDSLMTNIKSKIMTKTIDRHTITMRKLPEASFIKSLNFNLIPSEDFRL